MIKKNILLFLNTLISLKRSNQKFIKGDNKLINNRYFHLEKFKLIKLCNFLSIIPDITFLMVQTIVFYYVITLRTNNNFELNVFVYTYIRRNVFFFFSYRCYKIILYNMYDVCDVCNTTIHTCVISSVYLNMNVKNIVGFFNKLYKKKSV